MSHIKVALLQLLPGADPLRKKGIQACRGAKEMGADIALFPEMWSSGYRILGEQAIPADSEYVETFSALAGELNMAIGITLLERWI